MQRRLTVGAAKLKKWRLRNRKTQVQMAELLSCDQSGYSKFEKGRRIPRSGTRRRIQLVTDGAVHADDWEQPLPRREHSGAAAG